MVDKASPKYPDFALRLQAAGKRSGVKISDIKAKLEVTPEMARRYWHGISKPRTDKLRILARLVRLTPSELEHGPELSAHRVEQDRSSYESEEALEIAQVWARLSPLRQEFYRESIFRDAALENLMPWLRMNGRPRTASYDALEKSIERNYREHIKQMTLDI